MKTFRGHGAGTALTAATASQVVGCDLASIVVVELARGRNLLVDESHPGAIALVGGADLRKELLQTNVRGNGEPSLGTGRKLR